MENNGEEIVFLGGKSYLPLFYALTEKMPGQRIVFFNSIRPPAQPLPNVKMIRFETSARTNWHYACAHDFAKGKLTTWAM